MQSGYGLTLAGLLTFVVIVSIITPGESKKYDPAYGRRNITMGNRLYSDKLLYNDRQIGEKRFLRVISTDFVFPKWNQRKNIVITYFQVLDMYRNEYSGYAYQTGGGVKQGFVGFHLKSQRNHGYDFNITIYGYEY